MRLNNRIKTKRIKACKKGNKFDCNLICLESVDSTNEYAKTREFDGDTIIIARTQSAGRGRNGKSFLSPDGGLYMSIVMDPCKITDAGAVTAAAAVAVMRTIKSVFGLETSVKWVNDIYYSFKKVCGILCESVIDADAVKKTVVGLGLNLVDSPNLPSVAGAIGVECNDEVRLKLAKEIYLSYKQLIVSGDFFEEYRERSFILGKRVTVLSDTAYEGTACGLLPDFSLVVDTADGKRTVKFGEVSVKEV